MNTRALSAGLIVILAGCAGVSHRAPSAFQSDDRRAVSRGPAAVRPEKPAAYHCESSAAPSAWAAFAELALLESWEDLVRVGAENVPLPYSLDEALSSRRPLHGLAPVPAFCTSAQKDAPGFAILLLPVRRDLSRSRQIAETVMMGLSARSIQGMASFTNLDAERLVSPDGAISNERLQLLVPIDSGSLFRLAPPGYDVRSGILLEGPEAAPSQPSQINNAVMDEARDFRYRLPTGTVRVLILKF